MSLLLVFVIVLIILSVVLGLGVFGVIPMSQVGINRLFFVLFVLLILLWALQGFGVIEGGGRLR